MQFIKARDNYELDILANPFGSPSDVDSDGEYFAPDTKFHEDKLPLPPAVYYHGGDEKGGQAPMPHFIGMTIKRWVDDAGVWYRVKLDETSEYAKRVWEAAKQGLARVSSGAVLASVRKDVTGKITSWMNGEVSIFDTLNDKLPANPKAIAMPVKALKKLYEDHNIPYPVEFLEADDKGAGDARQSEESKQEKSRDNEVKMTEKFLTAEELIEVLDKREAEKAKEQAEKEKSQKAMQDALDAAKAEGKKEAEEAQKAANRPINNEGFNIINHDPEMDKYEGLEIADHALLVGFLGNAGEKATWNREKALKSLGRKIESEENKDNMSKSALAQKMRSAGVQKANELNYSTYASYGDDWVTVAYSNQLWENIRNAPALLSKIPQQEIPQGAESLKFMLESGDPTFYKVAQSTAVDSTMGTPVASITPSKLGTSSQDLTVSKLGARTVYTGELVEDSIIPFMGQLKMQMQLKGGEVLEHVLIDGDTETGATTNINDIAGTPAGTEAFLVANGLRKLALVTNTANSRSAGGAFVSSDFLETAKLMGAAGVNALDTSKVGFVIDANTHWKALELEDIKTKDVFTRATIENGKLTGIFGFDVMTSPFMHYIQASRLANSAGKVDLDTATNNAYGAILAVRYDQWKFGWKRRMTLETVRRAESDSYELIAMMRFGIVYRDTEASAISYYVGV